MEDPPVVPTSLQLKCEVVGAELGALELAGATAEDAAEMLAELPADCELDAAAEAVEGAAAVEDEDPPPERPPSMKAEMMVTPAGRGTPSAFLR